VGGWHFGVVSACEVQHRVLRATPPHTHTPTRAHAPNTTTHQVAHTRLHEESAAKAATLESQLRAARDEAARVLKDGEGIGAQLEAARDAVKVRLGLRSPCCGGMEAEHTL